MKQCKILRFFGNSLQSDFNSNRFYEEMERTINSWLAKGYTIKGVSSTMSYSFTIFLETV